MQQQQQQQAGGPRPQNGLPQGPPGAQGQLSGQQQQQPQQLRTGAPAFIRTAGAGQPMSPARGPAPNQQPTQVRLLQSNLRHRALPFTHKGRVGAFAKECLFHSLKVSHATQVCTSKSVSAKTFVTLY